MGRTRREISYLDRRRLSDDHAPKTSSGSAVGLFGVIAAACSPVPAPLAQSGAATAVATVALGAATPIAATVTLVGSAATASPVPATANMITMTGENKFDPVTLTIAKGGTVTRKNAGSAQHTATDDPSKGANQAEAQLPSGAQAWDSGMIGPGQTFTHTFDVAGIYEYFCTVHESDGMTGAITVQ